MRLVRALLVIAGIALVAATKPSEVNGGSAQTRPGSAEGAQALAQERKPVYSDPYAAGKPEGSEGETDSAPPVEPWRRRIVQVGAEEQEAMKQEMENLRKDYEAKMSQLKDKYNVNEKRTEPNPNSLDNILSGRAKVSPEEQARAAAAEQARILAASGRNSRSRTGIPGDRDRAADEYADLIKEMRGDRDRASMLNRMKDRKLPGDIGTEPRIPDLGAEPLNRATQEWERKRPTPDRDARFEEMRKRHLESVDRFRKEHAERFGDIKAHNVEDELRDIEAGRDPLTDSLGGDPEIAERIRQHREHLKKYREEHTQSFDHETLRKRHEELMKQHREQHAEAMRQHAKAMEDLKRTLAQNLPKGNKEEL